METHGPLGVIWVGIGLICFYIALIWLNALLGVFLTPLFLIPATWLRLVERIRNGRSGESFSPGGRSVWWNGEDFTTETRRTRRTASGLGASAFFFDRGRESTD